MQKRVLVVDDNGSDRRLAVEYLNGKGFEALDCETPFEILHKLHDFRPDAVLLEINMPQLSGSSVAEVIRKHVTYGDTKIVMFSALDEATLQEYIDEGLADACYTKSDTFMGLSETIEAVFKRSTH